MPLCPHHADSSGMSDDDSNAGNSPTCPVCQQQAASKIQAKWRDFRVTHDPETVIDKNRQLVLALGAEKTAYLRGPGLYAQIRTPNRDTHRYGKHGAFYFLKSNPDIPGHFIVITYDLLFSDIPSYLTSPEEATPVNPAVEYQGETKNKARRLNYYDARRQEKKTDIEILWLGRYILHGDSPYVQVPEAPAQRSDQEYMPSFKNIKIYRSTDYSGDDCGIEIIDKLQHLCQKGEIYFFPNFTESFLRAAVDLEVERLDNPEKRAIPIVFKEHQR